MRQSEIAEGRSIAEQIEATCEKANTAEQTQRHLKSPEAAFLNQWVAKTLSDQLLAFGLDSKQAKAALLAESHTSLSDIVGGPAARPVAYPFSKGLDAQPRDIYDRWARPKRSQSPFPTTWPDLAIRGPFKIVFEGKYFREGSLDVAERQLVAAIHEALFYLGVPAITAHGREWGYDYACLIAYDASRDQTLVQAWNNLAKIHDRFWNDANLHVIIVGATQLEGTNFSAYQALFKKLGFTAYESHKVLKHPKLKRSVYFNRDRTGRVWFAVYEKDRAAYKRELWNVVPPPQKKDARPGLFNVEPKKGFEEAAFQDLL
jgi:hypothetical protein